MTTRKPVAAQHNSDKEVPDDQGGRRRKRVDLHALSPNQLTLFEQEDTER